MCAENKQSENCPSAVQPRPVLTKAFSKIAQNGEADDDEEEEQSASLLEITEYLSTSKKPQANIISSYIHIDIYVTNDGQ